MGMKKKVDLPNLTTQNVVSKEFLLHAYIMASLYIYTHFGL